MKCSSATLKRLLMNNTSVAFNLSKRMLPKSLIVGTSFPFKCGAMSCSWNQPHPSLSPRSSISGQPLQFRCYVDAYSYAREQGLCALPPLENGDERMTLVLDLDETLTTVEADNSIDYQSLGMESFTIPSGYLVVKRPGLDKFLVDMSKLFEIVLLTASVDHYADSILECLPDVFSHRLYRHHLFETKKVSELNRDLKKVIFLDNNTGYLRDNFDNMMCVKGFSAMYKECAKDTELEKMADVLKRIVESGKVHEEVKTWNKLFAETNRPLFEKEMLEQLGVQ
ncbi:hypothetical protein C9374_001476 [Naegleria lovaniensis]|uniref:Mitochondrial import inner membrane translocase subunit TIM50 n=1 Tax=Naegleria lovaniensis TaxID=51637 RepID=A0AA88KMP5_NAELO|nr:uncharacterized protein C9374_001476 [Naegleria lovaniensis]KAG2387144.1 hypothetical protein C9374_001476 [Naegleria lovaniensis]